VQYALMEQTARVRFFLSVFWRKFSQIIEIWVQNYDNKVANNLLGENE
jgi:hypothetical protein